MRENWEQLEDLRRRLEEGEDPNPNQMDRAVYEEYERWKGIEDALAYDYHTLMVDAVGTYGVEESYVRRIFAAWFKRNWEKEEK